MPGPMDGAVGSQIWLFANRRSDFRVDVIKDEKRLADIVFDAKKTGALVIGGGISKHHTIWWNMFKGGLDYACYITTAVEYDGSAERGPGPRGRLLGEGEGARQADDALRRRHHRAALVATYTLTKMGAVTGTGNRRVPRP